MSVIEADLSDYITRGILSQYNKEGVLYPIIYFLKQLSPAKYNYEIYNNVTDFINRIVQVLRWDLRPVKISTQDTELMEPVEL